MTDGDAGRQAVEAGVDVGQRNGVADQGVDGKLAALVKVDKARDVAHRHTAAHVAAADRFLIADQAGHLKAELLFADRKRFSTMRVFETSVLKE